MENENLQEDETTTETTIETTTIQDYQVSNDNYVIGTLGIIGSLGFIFGACLGKVYNDIFR